MTFCPHCRRGMCRTQIAIALAITSVALGSIVGVASGWPAHGLMAGVLHAVVPVATVLEAS
jgi:hypothetical protein